jgi:hypothetical protein
VKHDGEWHEMKLRIDEAKTHGLRLMVKAATAKCWLDPSLAAAAKVERGEDRRDSST